MNNITDSYFVLQSVDNNNNNTHYVAIDPDDNAYLIKYIRDAYTFDTLSGASYFALDMLEENGWKCNVLKVSLVAENI
jgi:hypothetical protein